MEQIKTRLISTVYQVSLQITPALNRFCLVSPILASLSDDFCKLQGISTKYRTLHYQLTGDIQSRISENTKTLIKLMDQFEIGFVEEHDIVFNVISKAVLPLLFATEVINHTSIGLIKILFLIDSTEIYLFGIQCRNVIWNLLKQTTR